MAEKIDGVVGFRLWAQTSVGADSKLSHRAD